MRQVLAGMPHALITDIATSPSFGYGVEYDSALASTSAGVLQEIEEIR